MSCYNHIVVLILAWLCDDTWHQKHLEQEECEHQISGKLECFYESTILYTERKQVFAAMRLLAIGVV